MSHLGDTNKMVSDTPRTHLQDRLLSMVHAFHDDQRKYAVRLLANDVADLEHKLNAAQKRIKRLEKDSERLHWLLKRGLAWRGCYDGHWLEGEWLYSSQYAIATIDKAKEAKL
jgi:predicted RNase H-like nuclease (RuvC/YqgF family)